MEKKGSYSESARGSINRRTLGAEIQTFPLLSMGYGDPAK
jgi:hypothetical protein